MFITSSLVTKTTPFVEPSHHEPTVDFTCDLKSLNSRLRRWHDVTKVKLTRHWSATAPNPLTPKTLR
ncbi:hypothetical protein E2C01_056467 [Portunus trituberculatus]|uniref:Uncharacterized protein n=1 Tax=Portunus trituberculatus TaxID=210409 RepID=A0A5B7GU77_PORTR|nr:hypothetical protein [Portunus trituberculatus]